MSGLTAAAPEPGAPDEPAWLATLRAHGWSTPAAWAWRHTIRALSHAMEVVVADDQPEEFAVLGADGIVCVIDRTRGIVAWDDPRDTRKRRY